MDLKQKLSELNGLIKQTGSRQTNMRVAALILEINAHLEDDKTEVPAEVFATLDSEVRKMCLQGLNFVLMSSMES